MTHQTGSRAELFQKRLSLVASISALNAEALKLAQTLGAVEMDVLRIELERGKTGDSGELVRLLHEAKMNAEAIQAAQAECEERIAAVEREVEEIDRLLAAVAGD